MPKYQFIYVASEDNFEVDLFTGHYIIAKNYQDAMKTAANLDEIIIPKTDLQVNFELHPNPHMCIIYNQSEMTNKPQIIDYRILKPSVYHQLVVCSENYNEISAHEFLCIISKRQKTHIPFEFISYGVREIKTRARLF